MDLKRRRERMYKIVEYLKGEDSYDGRVTREVESCL